VVSLAARFGVDRALADAAGCLAEVALDALEVD
jgi:hypothetical protein